MTEVRRRLLCSSGPPRQRGFTLLEVMIALGILFGALVILVGSSNANVRASIRAKHLTIATGLAQAKMLQIEEELLHEGFQDTAETMEGDFRDEGHPRFSWKAVVEKVELPGVGQLGQAGAGGDADGGKGSALQDRIAGFLGVTDATQAAGASILMSQFDVIKGVLESSIRKVTLTVKWKIGHDEEHLVVAAYFTDPKAVDQAVAGGSGGSGGSDTGGTR